MERGEARTAHISQMESTIGMYIYVYLCMDMDMSRDIYVIAPSCQKQCEQAALGPKAQLRPTWADLQNITHKKYSRLHSTRWQARRIMGKSSGSENKPGSSGGLLRPSSNSFFTCIAAVTERKDGARKKYTWQHLSQVLDEHDVQGIGFARERFLQYRGK